MPQPKITQFLSAQKKSSSDLLPLEKFKSKGSRKKEPSNDITPPSSQKRIKCFHLDEVTPSNDPLLFSAPTPLRSKSTSFTPPTQPFINNQVNGVVEKKQEEEKKEKEELSRLSNAATSPSTPVKMTIDSSKEEHLLHTPPSSSRSKPLPVPSSPLTHLKDLTSSSPSRLHTAATLRAKFSHLLPTSEPSKLPSFSSPSSSKLTTKTSTPPTLTPTHDDVLPHLRSLRSTPQLPTPTRVRPPSLPRHPHRIDPDLRVALPPSFEHVDAVFDALDYTVCSLLAQGRRARFDRLQPTVEQLSGRQVDVVQLQHILGVDPGVFDVQVVRDDDEPLHGGRGKKAKEGVMDHPYVLDVPSPLKHPPVQYALALPTRRRTFRKRLIQWVGKTHQALGFASSHPPWDPAFDLAKVTLPIHTGWPFSWSLSSSPRRSEVSKVQSVVTAIQQQRERDLNDDSKKKGSLLDRIRAKEAQLKVCVQVSSEEKKKKKLMLSRLFVIASTIKSYV
ncbi:hypothetical protein HMI55_006715 [Coelomomyces lativittatus]|nr:hypothetical protein HMI55_006715 [Coelomomyces lativittatus]